MPGKPPFDVLQHGHQCLFHEIIQTVVGAGDHTLREKHQWTPGFGQDLDGTPQRLAVHAFAVDAEGSHARKNPGQHPVLHEEVPTGDDVEWTANPFRQ